ncbi:hypothetical protein [Streptomyces sp. NBC_00887]|uniref:hypothetical protein n=1 Tax=Streptomyces sp. NBC_00887 TaxID=2975859 RepID=UPI00386E07FB|nr:hypothetical protein OG844_46530 [Streptomyces sp. NBC_00887]
MSDLSESQSPVDALSRLIPTVIAEPEADPELVSIGERYWALAGFAAEVFTPVWCEKAKDIDTQGWGHQIYVVAAAGVRAVVPDRQCPHCEGPLSLTSRTAFQQICEGDTPVCVDCNDSLIAALRLVRDPARKAKRDAAKQRNQQQQALAEAQTRWHRLQQEKVAARYATSFPSEAAPPSAAGVRDVLSVLAMLRYAPSTAPMTSPTQWPEPLHPNTDETFSLLGAAVRSGLLRIHPTSPVRAFEWTPPTFEDALREAEGQIEALPDPEFTGDFYPLRASYYAPYGPSAGKAVEQLDARLTGALDLARMTAGQHDDVLALAQELIAGESLRYFADRLETIKLPEVPDNHRARLAEAARKVAAHRPIGEIYNLVWRATRAAAEAAQANPHAQRANMSTYAVNRFESDAQRAAADPGWELKLFSAIPGHGPAAMTRTLFYNVLDSNPIELSVPQIRASLPEPADPAETSDVSDDSDFADDLDQSLAWLHSRPHAWDPRCVPAVLGALAEEDPSSSPVWNFDGKVIARAAAKLHSLYGRLAPVIGEREAALSVLAATELLLHPVTADGEAQVSGEAIRDVLDAALYAPAPEAPQQDDIEDGEEAAEPDEVSAGDGEPSAAST